MVQNNLCKHGVVCDGGSYLSTRTVLSLVPFDVIGRWLMSPLY